jgi:hypothetical protein
MQVDGAHSAVERRAVRERRGPLLHRHVRLRQPAGACVRVYMRVIVVCVGCRASCTTLIRPKQRGATQRQRQQAATTEIECLIPFLSPVDVCTRHARALPDSVVFAVAKQ